MRNVNYLRRLIKHKYYVLIAGWLVGAPLWRLLIHDWSKILPSEWRAFSRSYFGKDFLKSEQFTRAALKHHRRHGHHWKAWIFYRDSGRMEVVEMPDHFMREMVADWMAATKTRTGSWDISEWWNQHNDSMILAPLTRHKVALLVERLAAAFGHRVKSKTA